MLDVGQIIAGRYRIAKLIGVGGMGLVYQGRDTQTSKQVAIKVLNPSLLVSKAPLARFFRECRALMALKHPHIVEVIEVAELDNGAPVLVTELLIGRDLRQEVIKRGPLPIEEAVGYMQQAVSAAAAAHRASVIHRDIKPSNFFITQQSGERSVKLLDFGISKFRSVADEETVTLPDTALGTPHYMSPEQILSSRDVDERTDIWSLGVVLFYLLTDGLPFQGPSTSAIIAAIPVARPTFPRELRPEIPEALEQVILRCLEKSPDNRYTSADQLENALKPFGPRDGVLFVTDTLPSSLPPVTPPAFCFPPPLPEKPPLGTKRPVISLTPLTKPTVTNVPSEEEAKKETEITVAQSAAHSQDRQSVRRGVTRWLALAAIVATVGTWFWFKAQQPASEPLPTVQVSDRDGATRGNAPPATAQMRPSDPESIDVAAGIGDAAVTATPQSSPDNSEPPAEIAASRAVGTPRDHDTQPHERIPDFRRPAKKHKTPTRAKPPSTRPKPSTAPAQPVEDKTETRPLLL